MPIRPAWPILAALSFLPLLWPSSGPAKVLPRQPPAGVPAMGEDLGALFVDHGEWPDVVELQPVPGWVTYRYDIDATQTDRNLPRKETTTTTANAIVEVTSTRTTKGAVRLSARGSGKVVYSVQGPGETFTRTTTFSLSYTGKPIPEFAPVANNWLYGSKEKRLARFMVMGEFFPVGIMTYRVTEKGKGQARQYSGRKLFLPVDPAGQAADASRPDSGEEGEPPPTEVESLPFWSAPIRVPCYSVGGTAFGRLVRKMEDGGKNPEGDNELMAGGMVEGAFDGKRSAGSFRVKLADGKTLPVFQAFGSQEDLKAAWPGTLTVSWSLGKQPEAELVLEPEEPPVYDRWLPLPAGKAVYGEAPPPLRLRARFRPPKDSPSDDKIYGRIDFYLQDVTRHKGECTNYPLDGAPKDDLRFVEQAKQPPGIVVVSPTHVRTDGNKFNEAVVIVEATDTGAYGKLTAVCEDMGLKATSDATGETFLTIPRDENGNRIADGWEKDKGVFDGKFPAIWDEDDEPSGQRRYGDGYTLYEEYRGFMTLAGFVRTVPTKKDLFVYDPDGLFEKYYGPHNPAGLAIHYIDPTMMKFSGAARNPGNRWVNVNSDPDQRHARQYALFIKKFDSGPGVGGWVKDVSQDDAILGRPVKGGTSPADPYAGWDQFLKDAYIVRINTLAVRMAVSQITDPDLQEQQYKMLMESTVIHEIGHALGIHHHAPPGNYEDNTSVWQGEKECAMRYLSPQETDNPSLVVPQTRYCTQCFGQINVKMDP